MFAMKGVHEYVEGDIFCFRLVNVLLGRHGDCLHSVARWQQGCMQTGVCEYGMGGGAGSGCFPPAALPTAMGSPHHRMYMHVPCGRLFGLVPCQDMLTSIREGINSNQCAPLSEGHI